jgi:hypothetical protein
MKFQHAGRGVPYSMIVALGLVAALGSPALAQSGHAHGQSRSYEPGKDQKARAGALVKAVRESTERFKNVAAAEAEGYGLQFGCVSGPDYGAMGLHYVNFPLVQDGELDPSRPEIVIYEPLPNGRVRLIGADFLVLAEDWNKKHSSPPELMGQLMHLIESPNRYGLPAFYTLHVWAWKESSTGPFVNWHPNVSCDAFAGQPK